MPVLLLTGGYCVAGLMPSHVLISSSSAGLRLLCCTSTLSLRQVWLLFVVLSCHINMYYPRDRWSVSSEDDLLPSGQYLSQSNYCTDSLSVVYRSTCCFKFPLKIIKSALEGSSHDCFFFILFGYFFWALELVLRIEYWFNLLFMLSLYLRLVNIDTEQ